VKSGLGLGRQGRPAAVLACTYLLVAGTVAYLFQYRALDAGGEGLFGLSFGFGPLVKSIVLEGRYAAPADGFFKPMAEPWMFTAHRMPVIPYFLAAVGYLWNSALLAVFLKSLLVAPLVWSGWQALRRIDGVSAALAAACLAPAALMPSIVNIGMSLQMEEGFLIPMMFFLCAHLLEQACTQAGAEAGRRLWFPATVNGLLYLAKASMWPLVVTNAVLFPVVMGRLRASVPFGTVAIAAFALWGAHNLHNSGQFRLGNTWSSWCLYKGNNPHTDSIYPEWTVDRMDYEGLVESPADFRDEWAYERHNAEAGSEFIRSRPLDFLRLTAKRAGVFFLSVRGYPTLPPDPPGSVQARLAWIDITCMAFFRVMLGLVALATLLAWLGGPASRLRWFRTPGTAFMLFVGAYSAAYVIGFGYQRHVLPVMLPTLSCAAVLIGGFARRGRSGNTAASVGSSGGCPSSGPSAGRSPPRRERAAALGSPSSS